MNLAKFATKAVRIYSANDPNQGLNVSAEEPVAVNMMSLDPTVYSQYSVKDGILTLDSVRTFGFGDDSVVAVTPASDELKVPVFRPTLPTIDKKRIEELSEENDQLKETKKQLEAQLVERNKLLGEIQKRVETQQFIVDRELAMSTSMGERIHYLERRRGTARIKRLELEVREVRESETLLRIMLETLLTEGYLGLPDIDHVDPIEK